MTYRNFPAYHTVDALRRGREVWAANSARLRLAGNPHAEHAERLVREADEEIAARVAGCAEERDS